MTRKAICILFAVISLGLVKGLSPPMEINIGAIFFETEKEIQHSFEAAVNRVNENLVDFQLFPLVRRLSVTDGSIALQREACDLVDNGVVAIFGPSSKAESDIVALICNSTGIPHILFDITDEEKTEQSRNHQMTVNVYPSMHILSKAYADIVQNYGWRRFTIVYDADDAQAQGRMQDLLQLRDVHKDVVGVRYFRRGDDYRIMWKSIKGERRIVLDCAPDLVVELLNASIEFDLMRQFNHLFLTNLDTHNADLEELRDNVTFAVNVTAARLKLNGNIYDTYKYYKNPNGLLTVLVSDAVTVFAATMQNITQHYQVNRPKVSCDFTTYGNGQSWRWGRLINQRMKMTAGLNTSDLRSNSLQFDDEGQRISFNIEIYEPLDNYGMAVWDTKGQIARLHVERSVAKKIVYRVATRFDGPYFLKKPEADAQNLTGNDRYMGYAVDLIDALSKEVGFEYVFVPVADNAYGKYNKETNQWDGIIGEIINNDAHMGICDLTITQARKTVVDFTVPFMQLGIGILSYNTPQEEKDFFAYLEPFERVVWVYVMIAIFIVSFLFVFVARYSKGEWENPHPCNKDPDTLENMWNLGNSLYLTVASIMTAGCDILPKSASMRMFTAMWWIFAVIIANSYTANLAAFLTNSKREGSISDINDLAKQTKVKFGTMYGGSTYTLFAESNETVYRLAYNIMNNADPSAYTKDNNEGVQRVIKSTGNYMFLMETTTIEYNKERNCNLSMVGEKFGEKHYGIAVPLGAEYRSNISVGILRLSERRELFRLKDKWWKNSNGTSQCDEVVDSGDTPDLNFKEVRGIFYTLYTGVFIAILVGVTEFLLHTQKVAVDQKTSFKMAFVTEIKFVLSIWNNKKPIHCTPSASVHSSSRRSSEKTPKSIRRTPARESDELRELQTVQNTTTNGGPSTGEAKV